MSIRVFQQLALKDCKAELKLFSFLWEHEEAKTLTNLS